MSGTFRYSINRQWTNVPANYACYRFFWEMLTYFASHTGFDIISYGTGAVVSGYTTPLAWLVWATPTPFGDNSWFVIRAKNSSAELNSSGTRPWECKIQVANTAAYADCSLTNHGLDGTAEIVAMRVSMDGYWNNVIRDFTQAVPYAAMDGHTPDIRMMDNKASSFNLHIVGDDDTITWYGQSPVTTYARGRAGYMGQLRKCCTEIDKAEFVTAGSISGAIPAAGYRAFMSLNPADATACWRYLEGAVIGDPGYARCWPSYSYPHPHSSVYYIDYHMYDSVNKDFIVGIADDPWVGVPGEVELFGIDVIDAQYIEGFAPLGELRFWRSHNGIIAGGFLVGSGDWISVSDGVSGICMAWPIGEVSVF